MKILGKIKIFILKLMNFYQLHFKYDTNELNFLNHKNKKNNFEKIII